MKFAFKLVLGFLGTVLALFLLYLLSNVNFRGGNRKLSEQEMAACIGQLDSFKSDPLRFISDKFDRFDAVFIGEMHFRKQDLAFFKNLIVRLCEEKKIQNVGWEFGATEFQNQVDSIVNAPEFDRQKAIAVMRRANFYWNYEDYLEIFRTIWEVNRSRENPAERVRFLQLGRVYTQKKFMSHDPEEALRERIEFDFDKSLANIADTAVLRKNQKILIYCGLHHAFSRYRLPKMLYLKNNEPRGGEQLAQKHPGKIYMAALCSPLLDKWFLLKNALGMDASKMIFPFGGAFNQIYDCYQKPFAVDTDTPPFSDFKDRQSWYALDRPSGLKLRDFSDGYIFLNAFEAVEPVNRVADWVQTETDIAEVKSTLLPENAAAICSREDLLKFIEQQTGRDMILEWHSGERFW